jgi:hypothetical protein
VVIVKQKGKVKEKQSNLGNSQKAMEELNKQIEEDKECIKKNNEEDKLKIESVDNIINRGDMEIIAIEEGLEELEVMALDKEEEKELEALLAHLNNLKTSRKYYTNIRKCYK